MIAGDYASVWYEIQSLRSEYRVELREMQALDETVAFSARSTSSSARIG